MRPCVDVACVVCGTERHRVVCDAEDVRVQRDEQAAFHRRRLRVDADRAALIDRAAFTQDYATSIVACVECGHLYRDPQPSAETITETYEEDRYGADRLAALFAAQSGRFVAKAAELSRLLPPARGPAHVVEIGSFAGAFLAAAGARGWAATGIDPGEEVGSFCRSNRLTVLSCTAPEAPIATGSADAVAIWNTLDQLPEPRATLAAAVGWLRPGGVLVVRVPNATCFESLLGRLRVASSPPVRRVLSMTLAWNNLLAFPYLQGYSLETLDRLVCQTGLLVRARVVRDTLAPLADRSTKWWARWEEATVKGAARFLAGLRLAEAPWLDVYYRRASAPTTTHTADGSATGRRTRL